MYPGTCVTHVLWCMLGSLTRDGRENVPGTPGACTTCNFFVSGKRPIHSGIMPKRPPLRVVLIERWSQMGVRIDMFCIDLAKTCGMKHCGGPSLARIWIICWITFQWLSGRLQYLQCISNGDTAVLH